MIEEKAELEKRLSEAYAKLADVSGVLTSLRELIVDIEIGEAGVDNISYDVICDAINKLDAILTRKIKGALLG